MVELAGKATPNALKCLPFLHALTLRTPFIFSPSVTVVVVHNIVTGKTLEAVWKWSSLTI